MATDAVQTPLQALAQVKEASRHREAEIERSRQLFAEIESDIKRRRYEAREVHRDANRQFVAAVRAAQGAGLKINDLMGAVGGSYQLLNRLERQISEWDRESSE